MAIENMSALVRFFKVLGNESRLKILGLLAVNERYVGELADLLDLKEPTISHHLAMMKELGLVNVRAEGNRRIYTLDSGTLNSMNKEIFSTSALSSLVDDTVEVSWENKVLRTFVQDGRIKQLPAREKKLIVVMAWVAESFEPGVRFREADLNERLKEQYPDFASLRRYLIVYGFMQRENGIYWRTTSET